MAEIFDWPIGSRYVRRSAFFRVPRVAISQGIFHYAPFVEDLGALWRAEIVVSITRDDPQRYAFEAFLRRLHGGVNQVRIHDIDYDRIAPLGTGRDYRTAGAAPPAAVEWLGGAGWSTGVSWSYTGALRTAEPMVPAQAQVGLVWGAPGETIGLTGDTIRIGDAVVHLDADLVMDGAGTGTATLDPRHRIAAPAGAAVAIGARFSVPMLLLNRDAGANATDTDGLATYSLDLIEAANA